MASKIKEEGIPVNKHFLRIGTVYLTALLTYAAKNAIIDYPANQFLSWVGSGLVVMGLVYFFFEIRSNAPYFYGASQSAGSNANAAIVAGIGVGVLSYDLGELLIFSTCSGGIYIVILSFFLIFWERKSG